VVRGLYRASQALRQAGDRRQDWDELGRRYRSAAEALAREEGAGWAPATEAGAPIAFLRLNSVPWARVWLDFRDTGLITPVLELAVTPGRHVVALAPDCGPPEVVVVTLAPGERAVVSRELCPLDRDGGE
jgi:hypothetical protein